MILKLYLTQEKDPQQTYQKDLICRAKNTNIFNCYFYNENDNLVNISGDELYFMVKDNPSQIDNSAKLNKKITSFTDAQAGHTEIEITSTDTSSLLGNYIYAIKIKHGTKFYTLAEGNVCFQQNIITRES